MSDATTAVVAEIVAQTDTGELTWMWLFTDGIIKSMPQKGPHDEPIVIERADSELRLSFEGVGLAMVEYDVPRHTAEPIDRMLNELWCDGVAQAIDHAEQVRADQVTYLASILSGEFAEDELPMSAECYKAALYVVANALVDCTTLGTGSCDKTVEEIMQEAIDEVVAEDAENDAGQSEHRLG